MRGARTLAALTCAAVLAGCGAESVAISPATPAAADRAACRALVADLPEELDGRPRLSVTPEGAAGAAWGEDGEDPTVLVCGPGKPDDGLPFAFCETVNGLDWYAPESASASQDAPVTLSLVGRRPAMRLTLPAAARPPVEELVGIAAAIKRHTRAVRSACR